MHVAGNRKGWCGFELMGTSSEICEGKKVLLVSCCTYAGLMSSRIIYARHGVEDRAEIYRDINDVSTVHLDYLGRYHIDNAHVSKEELSLFADK